MSNGNSVHSWHENLRREVAWVYLAHLEQAARGIASDTPNSSSDGRVVRFDIDIAVTAHQHIQTCNGTAVPRDRRRVGYD